MENIVLIGLSGTGKTTTGKLLAQRLGKTFVDMDVEIEQQCGMSVAEIFQRHGERYFREQEHRIACSMLQRTGSVIATGGGAVLSPDNAAILKRCGVIVSLQAPPEIILERLEKDSVARPLLSKPDRLQAIQQMLTARAEKYAIADYTIETGALTPQDVVRTILDTLPFTGGKKAAEPAESPAAEMYGLIGGRLSHSLSPQIHSYIFDRLAVKAGYYLFPLRREDLAPAFNGLKLLGAKGVNVTIPYKLDIMPLLDEVSAEARAIGAVNTVVFDGRCARGYNTDYRGFGLLLDHHGIRPQGRNVTILGTGGAAKTAACYLRDQGAGDIHLVSRRPATGSVEFPVLSYQQLSRAAGMDLLINCTPAGMFPHADECPLEPELISRFTAVVDLIYNPAETRLLATAKALGLQACNGLVMLIGQAVYAEELWQGRRIPLSLLEPLLASLNEDFARR